MAKRILGLDLGTNSIGWGVVDDLGGGQFELIKRGVHIFPEGVKIEKGNEYSKASERTGYRSARRLKFRRKLRKIETLKVLSQAGFCPSLSEEELKAWQSKKIYPANQAFRDWCKTFDPKDKIVDSFENPYYFRWLVATETLDLDEEDDRFKLGRAFYHMAQRRGFKSNRLDAGSEDAIGALRDRGLAVLANGYAEQGELYAAVSSLFMDDEQDAKIRRFQKAVLRGLTSAKTLADALGFLEDFLNKRENLGKVKGEIVDLSAKMGDRTLGQYFWEECYQSGAKIRKVHTSRDEHYLAEFEYICNKQGLADKLKDDLFKAIFYQRPLKSQKGLVANCPFEPKKKRSPISHPMFEEFRMWQTLNNIKIKTQDDEQLRPLSEEEKRLVVPLFFRVSKAQFDFKDISKAIMKTLLPRKQTHAYAKGRDASEAHVLFNYRDNQSLSGCPFSAKLKNLFGEDYKLTITESYCGKKQTKDGLTKSIDDILHEVWHVLFSFDDEEKVKEYAKNKLGLDDERAEKFAKITPRQGYGALSLKAIRKILPYLERGLLYSHAVFFANLDQVVGISADENEKLKADISALIDEHNQYVAEARCVNEFVREYKDNPNAFEQKHDLRKVQEFGAELPEKLRGSTENICRKIRCQILKNNGNGEYLPVKRLDERIGDYLMKEFGVSSTALEKLYHPSAVETYKPAEKHSDGKYYLGDPRISSIKNPVFMRAMHRVKAVVNELLKQGVITDQTLVHVEMARELNDANKRAAIKTWQRNNEKKRADFKKRIEEDLVAAGIMREATEDEILKYQLWEEQNRICPYTGKPIAASEFIGENPKYDIEHTIPRSLSCDNSQENKTLCDRDYNRNVKKKRIPFDCPDYQEILARIEPWQNEVERLNGLIEKKRSASRAASTKEAKDRAIQERVRLELDRNYLREKYRRFTMEEVTSGFKNSQLVDTRIITKYARLYLQTVFSSVHTVNGKTTDDFRRCWGIEKSRDNHVHHTVDAIVVACVTRNQYDQLARFYHDYESYEQNDSSIPAKPHFSKPWKTFTEDMKNLKNEILVSHYAPNHLLKQTKKWIKVHGEKKKVLQQGKTARGSLHQETFYGAIKRIEKDKKGNVEEVIKYVVRKPLSDLSDADLKKIVDDRIREIAIAGRKEEMRLKKEVEVLKKRKQRSDDEEDSLIQHQIDTLEDQLSNIYVLPNKNGSPTPIKKVRIYSNLTNPIKLKAQRDVSGKRSAPYKEKYYVNNDGNYLMAIYEGKNAKGKLVRDSIIVENLSAVKSDARSLVPADKEGLPLKCVVRGGMLVLLLRESEVPADVWDMSDEERAGRMYIVRGLDDDGIKLYFHQEARQTTEVLKHMNAIITESNHRNNILDKNGNVKESKLTTPKGGDVVGLSGDFPYVKFKPSNFNALLEGVDFRVSVLGMINAL